MLKRILLACLVASCFGSAAMAESIPIFGPETYPITEDAVQSFDISFENAAAGRHLLHIRNGAGDEARVASAEVVLNDRLVLPLGLLDEEKARVGRPVDLVAGTNEMTLTIEGEVGDFVTVLIAPVGDGARFVAGRMVLPWGRTDEGHGLALALRNDSRHAPRAFRVLFFNPAGELVAASEPHPLPPRGSAAINVEQLMDNGSWSVGSLEVIYTGPGRGRLFGTARQGFPLPEPATDTQPLIQAGFGRVDPPEPGDRSIRR